MYCPKCGNNVADNAKFCNNCGHSFSYVNNSKQQTNYKKQPVAAKKKSNNGPIIAMSIICGSLLVALAVVCLLIFCDPVRNLVFGPTNNDAGIWDQSSPRDRKFFEVVNTNEQALAWYYAAYDSEGMGDKSDRLKTFRTDMQKCYDSYPDFSDIPEKFTKINVDDNEGDELIILDKKGNIATYLYDEKYNTIVLYHPGSKNNNASKKAIESGNINWVYLEPAVITLQIGGTIMINTAKDRAADPSYYCNEFSVSQYGDTERRNTLDSPYMGTTKQVVFCMDAEQEYPIRQLFTVSKHKFSKIELASSDDDSKDRVGNYDSWQKYSGQHVTLRIDITKCDAPSGVTGLGIDIFYYTPANCVVN